MLLLLLLLLLFFTPPPLTAAAEHCSTLTTLKSYQKCMSLPSQDASLAWTYHPHNATLDLAFTGTFISPSGWVAWGLNPTSPQMTGTRALIAFSDPTSGGLVLLPYINPYVKLQHGPLVSHPLDTPSSPSPRCSAMTTPPSALVSSLRSTPPSSSSPTAPASTISGIGVQGYSLTIHPMSTADLASRTTIDVVSTSATVTPSVPSWAKPKLGALNALFREFLLPVGVVLARYVLGIAGFAIGIAMGNASPGVTYTLHRGLGVAVVVAGGMQSLALLFRPSATHRFRKYWKSYHHFVGYGCVVLGVVNVFQGMEIMGLGRSYGKLGYCVALSTLLGICVALEVNAWVVFCRKAKEEKLRREGGSQGFHHVRKGSF
ncbi:hypothetical protein J5N97_001478 [Dioscorea zingiberensis]|uniref:Cytochrome b561 and DOMON domain-containing protein n=1 Tax=Dioscorea zingiberensis TaxID=325984 RepID=A0A9D5BU93_9LILI|nr:hypothetical protein J5N97_001478 [Dioscorea zingiberensis]